MSFAVTMASGILSIAADQQHLETLSWLLFAFAVAAGFALLVVRHPGRARLPPDVAFTSLTAVAGAAVLGSRLAAPADALAVVLWALAAALWLLMAPPGVRLLARPGAVLEDARGEWCLAAVAPASLAVLAAELAAQHASKPWRLIAVVLWLMAVGAYGLAISALVRRLIRRRLQLRELTPDWWIVMGALAIVCLAASAIATTELLTAAKVAWIAASALIPVLGIAFAARIALAGVGRPMALWAGVFPLGMYSAASQRLAPLAGWHALHDLARAFLWIGLAAWGASLAANVLALRR